MCRISHHRIRVVPLLVLVALLGAPGHARAQPPETILIQGQLLDGGGNPIPGLRQYRVRFFDAESGGAQLGPNLTDFTLVSAQGLFAIPLVPPTAVLNASQVWYELAIDSNPVATGVDDGDVFPERVKVHSVPFARVAGRALQVPVSGVGNGSVSQAEFNRLSGLTGNIQAQLNAKADANDIYTQPELDAALAGKLPKSGPAHVIVEVTDDEVQNGANLLAAYAQAAALTPHGSILDVQNRAVVLVPPGRYNLGSGQLELDTEFVDLIGLSTARDHQYIFGTSSGLGTGVLRQTADDVRIENLFVECTRDADGVAFAGTDPAAYFPDNNLPKTVVRNCRFQADDSNAWSMRIALEYAGTYIDCTAGVLGFAGHGMASGVFINCAGDSNAFGNTASGSFTRCTAGAFSFGYLGTASGTFINCTGELNSFGAAGIASGLFINCTGGVGAFGGLGLANGGRFYYCVGGANSFTMVGLPTVLYCVSDGEAYP